MKKRACAFTMVHNEKHFLPHWIDYYGKFFGEDLLIIDHQSTDGSTGNLPCRKITVKNKHLHDNDFLLRVPQIVQRILLRHYRVVLYTDVDEFVVPDPLYYRDLADYIDQSKLETVACNGWEVVHVPEVEKAILWHEPLLIQREYWHFWQMSCKPLLTRVPLRWDYGKHLLRGNTQPPIDKSLYLLHLHRIDYTTCEQKHRYNISGDRRDRDKQHHWGDHEFYDDRLFRQWFFDYGDNVLEKIPERIRGQV